MKLLLACLVVLAGGCAADSGTSAVTTPPAPAADAPKPVAPVPDKSAADPTPPAPSDQEQKQPGFHTERVNQLSTLKTVPLTAAHQTVSAWIMDTESKREEGMMFLTDKDVKENQGMIFLFSSVQTAKEHSFWMHNCPLGLDIIYLDKTHHVINSGDGKPQSDAQVLALKDYYSVLEVKRGWSKRHGLKPGDLVGMPSGLKAAD